MYRPLEKHPQARHSVFAGKTIVHIENAIPTEKHPQPSFLTQNAM
jgi:hypothetical protein